MPVACDLKAKQEKLASLTLQNLRLVGSVYRDGRYLRVRGYCHSCRSLREYNVDNLIAGKTRGCRCLRGVKYGRDPFAKIFGTRYDALKQRCENTSSPLYPNYGARGITCDFESREAFISYMLRLRVESYAFIRTADDLRYFRITRIDDSDDYTAGNIRLVSRKAGASDVSRVRLQNARPRPLSRSSNVPGPFP